MLYLDSLTIIEPLSGSTLESLWMAFLGKVYDDAGAIWRRKNLSGDEEEILLPLKTSLAD